ncbi:hypothetical protein EOD41_09055 [Mucilaginibacter limnophilus]|uniref:Uncharacterized protein n=1 Tax=Mucilaginibacter limnophilus TaxID=1932778 RepID=A0A3S2UQL8_9SPHI|nr:hypothetical protein [Mucilaginibacter limnophilus]RVU02085.1 hypothetical protein EOD41_09055 [Mucilaginibacter limnophilus]
MMEQEFDLMISFRTPDGFKRCAQYFLGADRDFAYSLFDQLSGTEGAIDHAILHLDLIGIADGLPVKVKSIGCKLSELGENCELITRELFRKHAIHEAGT